MLRILLLCYIFVSATNGHNNKLSNDADLQSEVLPQELNPFFVSGVESQLPAMPLPIRLRRNSEVISIPENNTMQQVKTYTRIVAGVVLVLSAIVEIVAYIMESYAIAT